MNPSRASTGRTDGYPHKKKGRGPRAAPFRTKLPGRSDAAHAEIFDLEEVIHAVFRAFAAETGLLDATERRDLGRDDAGVDPDNAAFDRLGYTPDTAEIAGIEIRGQSEFGI